MRIAVISDIHSNTYALEAVLKDIDQRQVDQVVCLGDLVGYLTDPNGVIDRIKSSDMVVIQGNHDQKIALAQSGDPKTLLTLDEKSLQSSASFHHTNQAISEANRSYLKLLPFSYDLEWQGRHILFVHGSPANISEYLYEGDDKLEAIAKAAAVHAIVCGHTHVPSHSVVEQVHFINPGSVGKPKHGNSKAVYVILEVGNDIISEFHEVTYDLKSLIRDIENSPWINNQLIEDLKQGDSID